MPYLLITLITIFLGYLFSSPNEEVDLATNFIISILIYPLNIGLLAFILKKIRKDEFDKSLIFKFYSSFLFVSGLFILTSIFITLWTLLLIIPGMIAALSYNMAPYLMADGNKDPLACLDTSKKMMKGYKWDYLKFILSFLGWILTIIVTFWYVIPYILVADALYYEELKKTNKID